MTQSIDFEMLKNAFASNNQADVKHINGDTLELPRASDSNNEALKQELEQLRQQLTEQISETEAINADYQKALRQLNALNQDQKDVDVDLQRLHEDKIRLVRSLSSKQHELESVKKQLTGQEATERALRVKLSHAKHSIGKLTRQQENVQAEIKNKDLHILQLKAEVEALKETKTFKHMAAQLWQEYSQQGFELAQNWLQEGKRWLAKKQGKSIDIVWTPVSRALPKNQCMVYVRNGQQSDVALYTPSNKSFKCANAKFKIQEWAFVS